MLPQTIKAKCVVAILVVGLATSSSVAWEVDIHYSVTFWLAAQAGFSPTDADTIAKADQSFDESASTAAVSSMLWALLKNDVVAARQVQEHHFPSDGLVPGLPATRAVAPNSRAARKPVEAATARTSAPNALVLLGESLHPFQDSWAHAGIPDDPLRPGLRLRPELSFAHPKTRGGWSRHDADLAALHPDEAVAVARETYKLLQQFLNNNPRYRKHASAKWEDLQAVARLMAEGATKEKKWEWSNAHLGEAPPASRNHAVALLTAHGETSMVVIASASAVPKTYAHGAPDDLVATARAFLDTWLRKQDVNEAASFVEWSLLREQFASTDEKFGSVANDRDAIIRWCHKFMAMYLAPDHAQVNELGHCNPAAPGYEALPESAGEGRKRLNMNVAELTPDRFSQVGNAELALVMRFDNLPHDAVGLVWRNQNQRWVIVRMLMALQ